MAVADDVLESMDPDPDQDGHNERSGGREEDRRKAEKKAKIAINVNVIANVLLVIAKLIASFSSGSLSLIASLVDSVLDLICTLIVWTTNKLVQWRLNTLQRKFPVGKKTARTTWNLGEGEAKMLPAVAVGALLATIIVKGINGLCCIPIKTTQVQALVQDAKTDVVFNSLSLLFPVIGYYADAWWLDPVGAAPSDKLMKKLMYLGYRFSPVVEGFKSVTAYHAGDGIWVEYDILMKGDTKLARTHDIAETLQYCAEGLTDVDRCFVSIDYSISGPSGHNTD
ncbi:hypothetical protein MRB53_039356 [Persea americana]|nr:hypothetical protein MRB53_039356 [Persea americana]